MNTNYLMLLQIIENFASEHIEIKRFKSDFLDQLGNFGTKTEAYPIMYVTPSTIQLGNYTSTNVNTVTVNVYCVDVIDDNRDNVNTILNTSQLVLNDLHVYLKDGIDDIGLISVSNLLPLNNYMLDETAGWYMTITVEIIGNSICEIPFNNAPTFPSGECDIVYSAWATQDQIIDLQTQITILQGMVDNLTTDLALLQGMVDNLTTTASYTVELVDVLTIDFYAPYTLSIDSISNVLNTPTTAIFDDGVAYTLGQIIATGSKITVTVSTAAVVNLNLTVI